MFPWDLQAKSSLRSTYTGHLSPSGWSKTMDSEGSTHCTILTPDPSLPHSSPCLSSSHWTGVWEAQSAAIFPHKPTYQAMEISQLCFLATHLALWPVYQGVKLATRPQASLSSLEVGDEGSLWKGLGCMGGVSAANHLWISSGKWAV